MGRKRQNRRNAERERKIAIRKRIAAGTSGLFVAAGWGIADRIWPTMSATLGIPLLVFCLAAVIALETYAFADLLPSKLKKLITGKTPQLSFIALATFALIGGAFLGGRIDYNREASAAADRFFGRLKPAAPVAGTDSTRPKLKIGGTTLVWDGPKDEPILIMCDGSQIFLKLQNGNVLVTLKVRDDEGNLVAAIEDNVWQTLERSHGIWDRNYNDSALEVIRRDGEVALQVSLFGDTAEILGEWRGKDGCRTGLKINGQKKIKTMFKYPSQEFFGVLADG